MSVTLRRRTSCLAQAMALAAAAALLLLLLARTMSMTPTRIDGRYWLGSGVSQSFPRCGHIPMVVHLIHGLWDPPTISAFQAETLHNWATMNPKWYVLVWTARELETVLGSDTWARINGIANHGQRTDMARYLLLKAWGGVYADFDVRFHQPLEAMLKCNNVPALNFFAVAEDELPDNKRFTWMARPARIGNFLFGGVAGDHRLRAVLALATERQRVARFVRRQSDVLWSTGPDAFTEALFLPENAHARSLSDAVFPSDMQVISHTVFPVFGAHLITGGWRDEFPAYRLRNSFND